MKLLKGSPYTFDLLGFRNNPDNMDLGDELIPRCDVACQTDEGMLRFAIVVTFPL